MVWSIATLRQSHGTGGGSELERGQGAVCDEGLIKSELELGLGRETKGMQVAGESEEEGQ